MIHAICQNTWQKWQKKNSLEPSFREKQHKKQEIESVRFIFEGLYRVSKYMRNLQIDFFCAYKCITILDLLTLESIRVNHCSNQNIRRHRRWNLDMHIMFFSRKRCNSKIFSMKIETFPWPTQNISELKKRRQISMIYCHFHKFFFFIISEKFFFWHLKTFPKFL